MSFELSCLESSSSSREPAPVSCEFQSTTLKLAAGEVPLTHARVCTNLATMALTKHAMRADARLDLILRMEAGVSSAGCLGVIYNMVACRTCVIAVRC